MIVAARAGAPASISASRGGSPACCAPFQWHFLCFKSKGPTSLSLPFCNGWTVASRCAYLVSASKRREAKKIGGRRVIEDADDFLDGDDFEEEEEGVEEEDEEDMLAPLHGMNEGFRWKPAGFGKGKTYDLSLEDKLMEEIKQSKKAQLANINKLKNLTPEKQQKSNQQQHQQKTMAATEVAPGVSRVRIGNLPKKKNIHRDLKLIFESSGDILSINPAVNGNRKTREPVCKGFAFVDFRSKEAAERFVEKYSNQSYQFGKVNKCIVCHIMNQSKLEESGDGSSETEQRLGDVSKKSADAWDDAVQGFPGNQIDNEEGLGLSLQDMPSKLMDDHMNRGDANLAAKRGNVAETASRHPSSGEKQNKGSSRRKSEKKPTSKSKVGSLGSATRLKSKERTVLAGVFSKYKSGKAVASLK